MEFLLPPRLAQSGFITAGQLVVRYQPDLPPMIQGLSFTVKSGGKIGMCGRTGESVCVCVCEGES